MAQRTQVELVDDIDGSRARGTVRFTVEGREWELDLSAEHLAQFAEDMRRWTQHARRVGVHHGAGRRPARRDPAQTAHIRTWAAANGFDVGPRTPISAQIVQAYEAAHQDR